MDRAVSERVEGRRYLSAEIIEVGLCIFCGWRECLGDVYQLCLIARLASRLAKGADLCPHGV